MPGIPTRFALNPHNLMEMQMGCHTSHCRSFRWSGSPPDPAIFNIAQIDALPVSATELQAATRMDRSALHWCEVAIFNQGSRSHFNRVKWEFCLCGLLTLCLSICVSNLVAAQSRISVWKGPMTAALCHALHEHIIITHNDKEFITNIIIMRRN